jgi:hypothetical protein
MTLASAQERGLPLGAIAGNTPNQHQMQMQALKPRQRAVEVRGNQLSGFLRGHMRASVLCLDRTRGAPDIALAAVERDAAISTVLAQQCPKSYQLPEPFQHRSHKGKSLSAKAAQRVKKVAVFCIDRGFGRFLSPNHRSRANSCRDHASQATDPLGPSTGEGEVLYLDEPHWARDKRP